MKHLLSLFTINIIACATLFAQHPDTTQARRLLKEAQSFVKTERFKEALEKTNAAATIFIAAGASESVGYADVLHEKTRIFLLTGRPDSAIAVGNAVLPIREKILGATSPPVAFTLLNLGSAYQDKRQLKKALEYYQTALDRLLGKDISGVAKAYSNMGNCYALMGDLPKAVEYADKALAIREREQPIDSVNLAQSYKTTGNLFYFLDQPEKAVQRYALCLGLNQRCLGERHSATATAYCSLGVGVQKVFGADSALTLLQRSLNIRQQVLPPDHIEMAETYINMALALNDLGDYDRAIEYSKNALDILKKKGLAGMSLMGITHINYGNALIFKNLYDEAIAQFEAASSYFNLTMQALRAADALNNIGTAYEQKGDWNQQARCARDVLTIRRNQLKEHPEVASALINLGLSCYHRGVPDSATILLDQAEAMLLKTASDRHPHFVTLHNGRALVLRQQGRYDAALASVEAALRANRYAGDERFDGVVSMPNLLISFSQAADIWKNRADSLQHPDHLDRARHYCRTTLAAIGYLRAQPLDPGSLATLNTRVFSAYETTIGVNLALWRKTGKDVYFWEAFGASEAAKSYTLALAFQKARVRQVGAVPTALTDREQNLEKQVSALEKKRFLVENQPQPNDSLLQSLNAQLLTLKSEYRQLLLDFKSRYPAYYNLKRAEPTQHIAAVQQQLQPGQCMLEYFSGDSMVYLFAITQSAFTAHGVKKNADFQLEDRVRKLRYGLTEYNAKRSKSIPLYNETARAYAESASYLFQKLVAPVERLLAPEVVVVPDGALSQIPFDVLLSSQPANPVAFKTHAYLGKDRRISYAYSAALLQEMQDKKHDQQPAGRLLSFAPFYRNDMKKLYENVPAAPTYAALRNDTLAVLPHSGPEALAAAKAFNGKSLLGKDADKATFGQEVGDYRILHLSTHARADYQRGDYAYLAFAAPGQAASFEKLYVRDVYSLRLNADLVVLSACETGDGELRRGEGTISLARAFAYAGAKSIIPTLWPVNDAATAQLMKLFYDHLHTGMSRNEALQQAKSDFLTSSLTDMAAHPYYWSGFVPVGDMGK